MALGRGCCSPTGAASILDRSSVRGWKSKGLAVACQALHFRRLVGWRPHPLLP